MDVEKYLAELEQRKAWRRETAQAYAERGDQYGAAWFYAMEHAYSEAIYSLRHYHLGEPV